MDKGIKSHARLEDTPLCGQAVGWRAELCWYSDEPTCKRCQKMLKAREAAKAEKVVVTATRAELHDMGICSAATFDALLSGCPFTVVRREKVGDGTLVYLSGPPFSESHLVWVREQFTKKVETKESECVSSLSR